jgi:hypothetical protein
MTSRQSILALISLSLICLLVGCGSSSSSGNNTQPISVSLSTTPASLAISAPQAVTATVTNDTKSAGVTWSVSCGSAGACGSFSATTSPSGTSVTYTAPPAVPTGNTVTITATSVTDTTKSASATITIAKLTVTLNPTLKSIAPTLSTAEVATVTGDQANAGVTWSCTPTSACGSFSPTQTASGNTSTFTAPSVTGNVVVTATSVTDASAKASATITVTSAATNTLAPGNYVFSLSGTDATNSFYSVSGVFTVSSTLGVISGGEQDFVDFNNAFTDAISSGSYSFDSNGNLQISLNTNNPALGPGGQNNTGTGIETLDATLVSGSRGLITEFDTWATSSGTLDRQTSTSLSLPASYAFSTFGEDNSGLPIAIGGVLSIDGSNNISGVFDINDDGTLASAQSFDPSTLTPPDSSGRAMFTLNPSAASGVPGIILTGYVVDGTQVRLVEASDALVGTTGGNALAQTSTGTFSATSISGANYVFATPGFESTGAVQVAGLLTASSGGALSGTVNFNDIATQSPQGGTAFTGGSYTVDPTGRVTLAGITDGSTFGYNLQLYLTGDGHALVISMDSGADVLAGFAFQQAAGSFNASSFAGNYAMNIGQAIPTNSGALTYAGVGPLAADGVATLSGFVDLNEQNLPTPALPLTGTFTANANGIFTGTISGLNTSVPANFTYYVIDPGHVVAIETDNLQETLGYLELQH